MKKSKSPIDVSEWRPKQEPKTQKNNNFKKK